MEIGTTISVTAGPDAGRKVALAPSVGLIGRAPNCTIVIADPAIEAHHVAIEVTADGHVSALQLAGRSPVLADGQALGAGCVAVRRVLEVGDTRLEIDAIDAVQARLVEQTEAHQAPVPIGPGFGDRLVEAASLRRVVYLDQVDVGAPVVVLGVGSVRLPIELCDDDGRTVDPSALPLESQVLLARREWHRDLPVVLDLTRHTGGAIAVVDDHPDQWRAQAIVRSVRHQANTAARDTEFVVAAPGDPRLERCAAVFELGARWRARWTPDTGRTQESVRLHAAGRRPETDQISTKPGST